MKRDHTCSHDSNFSFLLLSHTCLTTSCCREVARVDSWSGSLPVNELCESTSFSSTVSCPNIRPSSGPSSELCDKFNCVKEKRTALRLRGSFPLKWLRSKFKICGRGGSESTRRQGSYLELRALNQKEENKKMTSLLYGILLYKVCAKNRDKLL